MRVSEVTVASTGDNECTVERVSPFDGKVNKMTLPVPAERVVSYFKNGGQISSFTELSASQREFLMTGYTEDDWNAIFKGEQ